MLPQLLLFGFGNSQQVIQLRFRQAGFGQSGIERLAGGFSRRGFFAVTFLSRPVISRGLGFLTFGGGKRLTRVMESAFGLRYGIIESPAEFFGRLAAKLRGAAHLKVLACGRSGRGVLFSLLQPGLCRGKGGLVGSYPAFDFLKLRRGCLSGLNVGFPCGGVVSGLFEKSVGVGVKLRLPVGGARKDRGEFLNVPAKLLFVGFIPGLACLQGISHLLQGIFSLPVRFLCLAVLFLASVNGLLCRIPLPAHGFTCVFFRFKLALFFCEPFGSRVEHRPGFRRQW